LEQLESARRQGFLKATMENGEVAWRVCAPFRITRRGEVIAL
jgi:hypothetical protein